MDLSENRSFTTPLVMPATRASMLLRKGSLNHRPWISKLVENIESGRTRYEQAIHFFHLGNEGLNSEDNYGYVAAGSCNTVKVQLSFEKPLIMINLDKMP
ncbi:hypothetical protein Tco_0779256 [Tanacetum coccineum]